MKTIAAGLKSAIADDGTVATCVKITRKDGVVKGFTDHDIQLTVSGVDYMPIADLNRIVMKLRNNAEVSNQEFIAAFATDISESDVANGVYNEASFDVLYVNWMDPTQGSVTVFSGIMGDIQYNADGFSCDIYNLMYLLDKQIGTIITNKCRHKLYSQNGDDPWQVGYCGVNEISNTYTGTVSSITTQGLKFDATGMGVSANLLANGVLTWTSGNNDNGTYEVKANGTGSIDLFLPTTYTIEIGDTFNVTAGCDKTSSTCHTKFNNIINFGGFPFTGEQ